MNDAQIEMVVFVVLGAMLFFILNRTTLIRPIPYALDIFSRNQFDEPTIASIQTTLDSINAENSAYQFTANSRANIIFRGNRVCLVDGQIGCVGFSRDSSMWRLNSCVYAVDDADNLAFFAANPSLFQEIIKTPQASIFRVNVKRLWKQLQVDRHREV